MSSQILIGMGLGILVGIFFGEYCAFLQIIGDAFIQLLQMTILPYITFSMIVGIGGFTALPISWPLIIILVGVAILGNALLDRS